MEHTLWKSQKCTLTEKKFRQINYLVISVVKTLLSRNFCQKIVKVNYRNFHTVPHQCDNVERKVSQKFREINTVWVLRESCIQNIFLADIP